MVICYSTLSWLRHLLKVYFLPQYVREIGVCLEGNQMGRGEFFLTIKVNI